MPAWRIRLARRASVAKAFARNLKVKVTAGTRLLEVDYTNRDPKVAAAVVNHLVQALIDYTFQTKFTATNQVSQWLEGQLGDLRKQSEQLQSRVVALQQGSGIFGVGGTDPQGKPVIYSPVLDRLQQSTAQLSQAQMNRVLKASVAEVVKTGNAELISQLSGTSIASGSGQGVMNSLALIQNLRLQEATLQAQIDQDASQFGAAYPKLIQERASLKGVQQSLQEEIKRTAERSENDFKVASKAEQGARAAYESDRECRGKAERQEHRVRHPVEGSRPKPGVISGPAQAIEGSRYSRRPPLLKCNCSGSGERACQAKQAPGSSIPGLGGRVGNIPRLLHGSACRCGRQQDTGG